MKLNKKVLSLLTASSFLLPDTAWAVTFDTSLLAGESRDSDLSRFYLNNDMPAGRQEIDVYVNHDWKGRYALLFGTQRDDIQIDYQDAQRLGIDRVNCRRLRRPRRRCRSPRWYRAVGSIWTSAH